MPHLVGEEVGSVPAVGGNVAAAFGIPFSILVQYGERGESEHGNPGWLPANSLGLKHLLVFACQCRVLVRPKPRTAAMIVAELVLYLVKKVKVQIEPGWRLGMSMAEAD